MPSIQDVADQIYAQLDAISQNTADPVAVGNGIRTDFGAVNAKLTGLDSDLQAGVSELAKGLPAIRETQKATIAILDYQPGRVESLDVVEESVAFDPG